MTFANWNRLVAIIITILVVPVSTMKCLQCNSGENPECLQGKLEATECPSKNHTFCTTYSVLLNWRRVFLFLRDCSSKDMGNKCRILPDDPYNKSSTDLYICYSTCIQNGCNKDSLRVPFVSTSSGKMLFSLVFHLIFIPLTLLL